MSPGVEVAGAGSGVEADDLGVDRRVETTQSCQLARVREGFLQKTLTGSRRSSRRKARPR
jgi:hypothetical protein